MPISDSHVKNDLAKWKTLRRKEPENLLIITGTMIDKDIICVYLVLKKIERCIDHVPK